jgi:hypothetical protein
MKTPICEHIGGCDREATRLFPERGWLCEEHFQQTLNAAADLEAEVRRKRDDEWRAYFEKYLCDHNLKMEGLTAVHAQEIIDAFERETGDDPAKPRRR